MDGNGRRDVWNSVPDALGTAANLLHSNGWQSGKTWGYEVVLPAGGERWLNETRILADWQKAGFSEPVEETSPARMTGPCLNFRQAKKDRHSWC